MMIRLDNKELKESLYDMWHRIFHDPAAYMDFYFDQVYGRNSVLAEEDEEGYIRGMLHMNPYTLLIRGQACPAHYIVGVATEEDCRRQGVMRRLIEASFLRLREKGEIFTYLMPADPDYYLPFGFRYGADWLEAELRFKPVQTGRRLSCMSAPAKSWQAEAAAKKEKAFCLKNYSLATAADAGYLHCLEQEAASEHDRVYYLYDGEAYVGRFVMGAAEDYMMLGRIVCCMEDRAAFLKEIMQFAYEQYHYGSFHLTLDESWDVPGDETGDGSLSPVRDETGDGSLSPLRELAGKEGVRLVSAKRKPMIMFRILNLEKAGVLLKSRADFKLKLQVRDRQLPDQDGSYVIEAIGGEVHITKINQDWEDHGCRTGEDDIPDGGEVSIGDLTSLIFGRMVPGKMGTGDETGDGSLSHPEEPAGEFDETENRPLSPVTYLPVPEEGECVTGNRPLSLLELLIPLDQNCVMEYV